MTIGMIKSTCIAAGLAMVLAAQVSSARADEAKKPIAPAKARATEIVLDSYDDEVAVVRKRTPGKRTVTFSADPQLLGDAALAVFRVRSISPLGSVTRWSCVAVDDVAECLGRPLKLRWLADDTRMELGVTLMPRALREEALIAAATDVHPDDISFD